MSAERRYDDEEVAEILERAAQAEVASRSGLPSPDGMTLAELQRIGAEAGLAPELIEAAASSLEARDLPSERLRIAGIPVGVTHTVPLARPFTQREWERMVARFRHTFHARGRALSDGDLRQWSNGNLQALTEPTGDGWVLRFSTRKSEAVGLIPMGLFAIVAFVVVMLLGLIGDTATLRMGMIGLMGAVGAGVVGSNALRLPAWANERERQFRELGERAMHMTAAPAEVDAALDRPGGP